jgi:hypothetical protein
MTETSTHNYQEGQVWTYHTRPNEQASTLLINKIEPDARLGFIYHISVSDVQVKNQHVAGGVEHSLPHFPVATKTLESSVTKLLGTSAVNPSDYDGYKTWKQEFDAGRAGIFTITVAEIVDVIETAVNQ